MLKRESRNTQNTAPTQCTRWGGVMRRTEGGDTGVTYEYALEHILERRLTAQTGYGCQAVPRGSDKRE
jgi:hypothetical protein